MTQIQLQYEDKHAIQAHLDAEWRDLYRESPPDAPEVLRALLEAHREELAQLSQNYLSEESSLRKVLDTDDARATFAHEFLDWTASLLVPDTDSHEHIFVHQEEAGRLMARIGLPPFAVSRGLRRLKLWFIHRLADMRMPAARLAGLTGYLVGLFDIALEIRETGYDEAMTSQARMDEAYRFHLLGQNLAMERERQRALLMEWGHKLLSQLYHAPRRGALPRLWRAEFGQWVDHKARILFEDESSLNEITDVMERVDNLLLPALEKARETDPEHVAALMHEVDAAMETLKFVLGLMFEAHIEIENGRDPLTRLLNRRFLPSVLMREIFLQKRGHDSGFCVLLLDIDHFKEVNDTYGHKAGDAVLRHLGATVAASVRPMDFVFRYGGEEIVVVAVDSTVQVGEQIASRILQDVANSTVLLPDQRELRVTVSIGLTSYQHDIDYETILARADAAMYRAKQAGRNRATVS